MHPEAHHTLVERAGEAKGQGGGRVVDEIEGVGENGIGHVAGAAVKVLVGSRQALRVDLGHQLAVGVDEAHLASLPQIPENELDLDPETGMVREIAPGALQERAAASRPVAAEDGT